jgi:hypothetical protein
MTRNALPPSLSATRMRRLRDRAKHGSIFVRFEMTPNAVDRLIALGWLNSESRRAFLAQTGRVEKRFQGSSSGPYPVSLTVSEAAVPSLALKLSVSEPAWRRSLGS